MAVLEHLEPKQVFHYFEELSAIPHGSRNTKAISDWCVAFAQERGLEVRFEKTSPPPFAGAEYVATYRFA